MPEEEFIISAIRAEEEFIVVSFSVTNTEERMSQLIEIAKKKWEKQYGGKNGLPENYKLQIIGGGIPPMIMRLPMAKWHAKGFQLNDRVVINVPENIDDIKLAEKKDNFFDI